MRKLFSVILCATLPLAAGFTASSAYAQGMQYTAPDGAVIAPLSAPPVVMSGSAPGVPGDMTRMAALEQQLRDLTNQLEQRDFQIRSLQTQFDKYKTDVDMRLQALEGKAANMNTGMNTAAPSTPVNSETPPSPTPMQNETPAQTQQPAATGGLTDPNGAFQPTSTPSLGQLSEKPNGVSNNNGGSITSGTPQGAAPANAAQAYDKAFSYLQQSNYQDAQTAFQNFLTTYPTHPLAANAQYWLGETYFAQTQYSTAAKTFAKSFQDHPQGQKAPDSLLKLAMTLDKMNKREDACLTLAELKKRFPAGPASVLRAGNEEHQRMGCKS